VNAPPTGSPAGARDRVWSLLGVLPDRDRPIAAQQRSEERREGYVLESWTLDLNGLEPVPALVVRPPGDPGPRAGSSAPARRAPAILYSHSHGGVYELGKRELVEGRDYLQPEPYAVALAREGWIALAIDHWCFGERAREPELETFKAMLWQGRVLWGMMVHDSVRALDWLAARPDVDPARLGALGMSMGSTMSQWVAALDERVKVTVDLHCLTEWHTLLAEKGLAGHGIYYYVPALLRHLTTAELNALAVPRAHLSIAGLRDPLTPPSGLELVDRALRSAYAAAGHPERWRLLRQDAGHQETAEGRAEALAFLRAWL
jgi:dienelactone hydrolase